MAIPAPLVLTVLSMLDTSWTTVSVIDPLSETCGLILSLMPISLRSTVLERIARTVGRGRIGAGQDRMFLPDGDLGFFVVEHR